MVEYKEMTKGYKITGGYPVKGRIKCMGAKNLATKTMVASLLAKGKTVLHMMPRIGDVEITKYLVESTGAKAKWLGDNTLEIDSTTLNSCEIMMPDSRSNRIPILFLSVLLHRFGKAIVPTVGGDNIGKRNVDFHLDSIIKFGGSVKKIDSKYYAFAEGGLKGCHINLPYPSVGATETALFLAVMAKGTSVISNIAIEPEIIELITMLRSMGAIIFMSSVREVTIQGVDHLDATIAHLIGDRIEAASWASLACASNGDICVEGIRPDLLGNFLSYYSQVGGGYELVSYDTIRFFRKQEVLKPVVIETDVFPGFSTDWQQPFAALLTQANGISVIHETVYEQRFDYLKVLKELGANAQVSNLCLGSAPCRYKGFDYEHSALIQGPTSLKSLKSPIDIPDIRAGLAYLVAAVLAKGETILSSVEQIERGYGDLQAKLSNTNLKIESIWLPNKKAGAGF